MSQTRTLQFVTCASRVEVVQRRLLASPCLQSGGYPLAIHFNMASAAQGFNTSMQACMAQQSASQWLVWLHQDVVLPAGWDALFLAGIAQAQQQFKQLAVVGVYGIAGAGAQTSRAGHVLDRGADLHEPTALPCLVDSLDELLFAVRIDSGLMLDPALGFDFYATDLVLQAQARGLQSAAVHAPCEHWSDTLSMGAIAPTVVERIKQSAQVFECKWEARLPVTTPCFDIARKGDTAAFIDSIVKTP
jgi:hypothetical protein